MVWPALLALGGTALAAGLSSKSSSKDRNLAQGQFDAQMDTTIQRRVADADKAGIHPLFALGASAGASPTLSVGNDPTSDIVARGTSDVARILARKSSASSSRDEAEAGYFNALTAQVKQNLNSRGHDGAIIYPQGSAPMGGELVFGPAEPYNPKVPTSKSTGVQSGTSPATQEYVFPDGRSIRTYGETLNADEIKQIDIIYQRAVQKGSDAFMAVDKFIRKLGK